MIHTSCWLRFFSLHSCTWESVPGLGSPSLALWKEGKWKEWMKRKKYFMAKRKHCTCHCSVVVVVINFGKIVYFFRIILTIGTSIIYFPLVINHPMFVLCFCWSPMFFCHECGLICKYVRKKKKNVYIYHITRQAVIH